MRNRDYETDIQERGNCRCIDLTGASLTALAFCDMKNIVIVYFSGSGHTRLMAESVQKGAAATEGVHASLLSIDGTHIAEGRYQNEDAFAQLAKADAIVFGSPTYMGGVAAQFKAFADASVGVWFQQDWKEKVAGGFTISGSPSGDKLSTLQYLSVFAAQHSMQWVNTGTLPSDDSVNRLGAWLGVMGQDANAHGAPASLHSGDVLTAEAYGRRIAE